MKLYNVVFLYPPPLCHPSELPNVRFIFLHKQERKGQQSSNVNMSQGFQLALYSHSIFFSPFHSGDEYRDIDGNKFALR